MKRPRAEWIHLAYEVDVQVAWCADIISTVPGHNRIAGYLLQSLSSYEACVSDYKGIDGSDWLNVRHGAVLKGDIGNKSTGSMLIWDRFLELAQEIGFSLIENFMVAHSWRDRSISCKTIWVDRILEGADWRVTLKPRPQEAPAVVSIAYAKLQWQLFSVANILFPT